MMTQFTGRISRTNPWSLPTSLKPCSVNVQGEVIKLTVKNPPAVKRRKHNVAQLGERHRAQQRRSAEKIIE
jgi:hypothetical protein